MLEDKAHIASVLYRGEHISKLDFVRDARGILIKRLNGDDRGKKKTALTEQQQLRSIDPI